VSKAEFDNLESDYRSLERKYDRLVDDYDALLDDYNALKGGDATGDATAGGRAELVLMDGVYTAVCV
jgi:outer membrane murein-binding lipoprotein Lpp